jgi:hypothetical protein
VQPLGLFQRLERWEVVLGHGGRLAGLADESRPFSPKFDEVQGQAKQFRLSETWLDDGSIGKGLGPGRDPPRPPGQCQAYSGPGPVAAAADPHCVSAQGGLPLQSSNNARSRESTPKQNPP